MARSELERTVRLSLLDRLIDEHPAQPADEPLSWAASVGKLKEGLVRDLEWLLNVRRLNADPAAWQAGGAKALARPELARSVYAYGLPDISSVSRDSAEEQRALARMVEEAITAFEPRLANVRVSLAGTPTDKHRELRFLVEGALRLEPNPEQVAFDTVLEIATGEVHVRGNADA